MMNGEIFILIGGLRIKNEIISIWDDDPLRCFRECCVEYGRWSYSKYTLNISENIFELLRELSKAGDFIAQNVFKEKFYKNLKFGSGNDHFITSLLRESNLEAFNDDSLVEIIRSLGDKAKLLVRAIRKVRTALRVFPLLEEYGFSVLANNLVAKFIGKGITFFLDNEKIWEYLLKYPKYFYRFFPEAIGILERRREYNRTDFLRDLYRST